MQIYSPNGHLSADSDWVASDAGAWGGFFVVDYTHYREPMVMSVYYEPSYGREVFRVIDHSTPEVGYWRRLWDALLGK